MNSFELSNIFDRFFRPFRTSQAFQDALQRQPVVAEERQVRDHLVLGLELGRQEAEAQRRRVGRRSPVVLRHPRTSPGSHSSSFPFTLTGTRMYFVVALKFLAVVAYL